MASYIRITNKASRLITLMITVSFVLFSPVMFAASIDSNINNDRTPQRVTTPRDASDPTAAAPYGKPFLLETGYANVNNRTTNLSGLNGSPGSYFSTGEACSGYTNNLANPDFPTAKNYYGTNIDLPFCIGRLSTTKNCPINFIPVITVTPSSVSAPVAGTPIFACIIPRDNSLGDFNNGVFQRRASPAGSSPIVSGYDATFATPATMTTRGKASDNAFDNVPSDPRRWQPFVSVSWEVYCYPNKKRTGTYGTSNINPPNMQKCNVGKSTTLDSPILLWDIGTMDSASSNSTQTFNTSRQCPQNFQPYVVMEQATVTDTSFSGSSPAGGRHSMVGASGVCVRSVATNGGEIGHRVSYLAKAASVDITYTNDTIDVSDPAHVNTLKNIPWKLYCYPPNFSPPAYPATCRPNQAPFQ